MQHNVLASASHYSNGIINGATASLVQDNQNEVQHDFCDHVKPLALVSSMASLHSFGQDDWNEVQYDIYGHMMPLVPVSASCDTNSIINGTNAFLSLRQSNWGTTQCFGYVKTWVQEICDANSVINGTNDNPNGVQQVFFGHVMSLALALALCDADSIINVTIAFLRSWQLKWGTTWLLGHVIPLAPVLSMATSLYLGQGNQIEMEHDFFDQWCLWYQHYMMPMASLVASWHSLGQDDQNDFWSGDTNGDSTGITWCQWCHQWHNYIC